MLRNSPFNRFWVALSVILVSSIVWLIVLYVTFSLSLGESLIYRVMPNSAFSGILAGLLHVWIVFELVFAVHYMLARRRLEKYDQEIPGMSAQERWGLLHECLRTVNDPEVWFTGWFRQGGSRRQPGIKDIRKGNVREWYI
jgi:uncharacterized membrane protein (DUF485 family)